MTLLGVHDKKLGKKLKRAMKKAFLIIFRSNKIVTEKWGLYKTIVYSNYESTSNSTDQKQEYD
jgi:hypothetical protein